MFLWLFSVSIYGACLVAMGNICMSLLTVYSMLKSSKPVTTYTGISPILHSINISHARETYRVQTNISDSHPFFFMVIDLIVILFSIFFSLEAKPISIKDLKLNTVPLPHQINKYIACLMSCEALYFTHIFILQIQLPSTYGWALKKKKKKKKRSSQGRLCLLLAFKGKLKQDKRKH